MTLRHCLVSITEAAEDSNQISPPLSILWTKQTKFSFLFYSSMDFCKTL